MTWNLEPADTCVLIALLTFAVAVGCWFGRGQANTEAYFLGGRSLPWWAVLGSIVATETSTATVLSLPGVGFGEVGLSYLQLTYGFIIGRLLAVRFLLPLYFQGRLQTAYEVLHLRFGGAVKKSAALLFLAARNLGDGLRLFLAAAVLHVMLGRPIPECAVVVGVVTIIYTWFGGIRSVVWNDCVQFVIYIIGGIAAVWILADRTPGGISGAWSFAAATDRLHLVTLKFSWDSAHNLYAGLIGGAFLSLGTHGTDHMMVQRYLCSRSQRQAALALSLSGLIVMLQFALFLWIGVQLACFHEVTGLPAPERSDEIFAAFIVHQFPAGTGLIGLLLGAVMAAAMSTLSSSLNASASSMLNDILIPAQETQAEPAESGNDRRRLMWSRLLTVGFGMLQIAIGIGAMHLERSVITNALTIAGFSAGILGGVFGLGVFTSRVGQRAALTGAATGLILLLLIRFRFLQEDGAPMIAWPWLPVIGSLGTFAAGVAAQAVTDRIGGSKNSPPPGC